MSKWRLWMAPAILAIILLNVACFKKKNIEVKRVEAWVNLMPTFDSSHHSRKGHILIDFELPSQPFDFSRVRLQRIKFRVDGKEFEDSLAKWEISPTGQLHIFNVELKPDESLSVVLFYEIDGREGKVETPATVVKAVY